MTAYTIMHIYIPTAFVLLAYRYDRRHCIGGRFARLSLIVITVLRPQILIALPQKSGRYACLSFACGMDPEW